MDQDAGGVMVNVLAGPRGAVPCPAVGGVKTGPGAMGANVVALSEPSARLNINPGASPMPGTVWAWGIAMAVPRIVHAVAVARITEAVEVRRIADAMGVVRHLVDGEDVINRAARCVQTPCVACADDCAVEQIGDGESGDAVAAVASAEAREQKGRVDDVIDSAVARQEIRREGLVAQAMMPPIGTAMRFNSRRVVSAKLGSLPIAAATRAKLLSVAGAPVCRLATPSCTRRRVQNAVGMVALSAVASGATPVITAVNGREPSRHTY